MNKLDKAAVDRITELEAQVAKLEAIKKEVWIAGWMYAAQLDSDYDSYSADELDAIAEKEYYEWKGQ